MKRNLLLCVATATLFFSAAQDAMAGAYIGAGTNNLNLIMHPSNYVGNGGNVTVRICISPASTITNELVIPVQNVIARMNALQPTTGNLLTGSNNNIPSNELDAESALLHETGHCIGLAHPNLATESGLPAAQRDYTKTTTGNNGSYDLNNGADNVLGSADDIRGDDINLHWFRRANNNPFTLDEPVDSTTYARSTSLLPGADNFATNAARAVSALLGVPNTEAVMQQGQGFDEAQRTLGHDDVATLRYGQSGVDEVAGTGDDYTTTLVYQGITTNNCDVTVSVDGDTGFASCSVGFSSIASGHWRITSATVRLNDQTAWFYNQVPAGGVNTDPVLDPIGPLAVAEDSSVTVPLNATDADGDTLLLFDTSSPTFCNLTDNGDGSGSFTCSPTVGDAGDYTATIIVADDGAPTGTDSETFDITVTPAGQISVEVCDSTGGAIPDNDVAGLTRSLTIGDSGSILDANVVLNATHTYVGDLLFTLIHADSGTSTVLIDRPGVPATQFGCGEENIAAIIDDEGTDGDVETTCISGGSAALAGSLTPFSALSVFDGLASNSDWTLNVSDNAGQDTGTLDEWCVSLLVDAIPAIDTDGDGFNDDVDNCQLVANPNQRDSNGDGYGNFCDTDLNNDCLINASDLGLLRAAFFSSGPDADFNGDGVVNAGDLGFMRLAFFGQPGPSGLTDDCASN